MLNKCEEKRHSIIITICCDAFLLKTMHKLCTQKSIIERGEKTLKHFQI